MVSNKMVSNRGGIRIFDFLLSNNFEMVLLIFFLFQLIVPGQLAEASQACLGKVVELSAKPTWTSSATWSVDGKNLIVVDVSQNWLLSYGMDGELVSTIDGVKGLEGDFYPSAIQTVGDKYLLENKDGHMVWLDENLAVIEQFYLINKGSKKVIRSVFNWAALDDKHMLIFGDLFDEGAPVAAQWVSAFLKISLQDMDNFETLRTIPVSSDARPFYLLGNPYVAGVDGIPFFAVMDDDMLIYKEAAALDMGSYKNLRYKRPSLDGKFKAADARAV